MVARRAQVPVWWLRSGPSGDPPVVTLHCFASSERPDASIIDIAQLPPGHAPAEGRAGRVRMRDDTQQVLRVEAFGSYLVDAPGLVYLERVNRAATPVSVEVIAFLHDDAARLAGERGLASVDEGTVLTANDAVRLGLTRAERVGAIHWLPATGVVVEVYVAPAHRRRRIGTKMLLVGEAFSAVRRWPRLGGGSTRTAMGQALVTRLRWGVGRIAALTHLAPPMTPAADAVGLPREHLEPDDVDRDPDEPG